MARNIIVLTRGDTYRFNLTILNPDNRGEIYTLRDNDVVYVGIMAPHQPFEEAMVRFSFGKEFQDTDGAISVEISSTITENIMPGVYYYSVKLSQDANTETERISTIINKTKFVVND